MALDKNAGRIIDLFREWDVDGDGNVTKKEFRKAMPVLGFDVPTSEVDKLFESFDPDGSGSIGYAELKKMLVVKKENKAKADAVTAIKGKAAASAAAKGANKFATKAKK